MLIILILVGILSVIYNKTVDKNAIIIGQICKDLEPGKKMLQKLMYLISRKGVDLGLNYSIHFFGPYSSKLDNAMHILESYDKLSIDTNGTTHIIRLGNSPIDGELDADDQNKVNFEEGEVCNVVIAVGYSDIQTRKKVRKELDSIVKWH